MAKILLVVGSALALACGGSGMPEDSPGSAGGTGLSVTGSGGLAEAPVGGYGGQGAEGGGGADPSNIDGSAGQSDAGAECVGNPGATHACWARNLDGTWCQGVQLCRGGWWTACDCIPAVGTGGAGAGGSGSGGLATGGELALTGGAAPTGGSVQSSGGVREFTGGISATGGRVVTGGVPAETGGSKASGGTAPTGGAYASGGMTGGATVSGGIGTGGTATGGSGCDAYYADAGLTRTDCEIKEAGSRSAPTYEPRWGTSKPGPMATLDLAKTWCCQNCADRLILYAQVCSESPYCGGQCDAFGACVLGSCPG